MKTTYFQLHIIYINNKFIHLFILNSKNNNMDTYLKTQLKFSLGRCQNSGLKLNFHLIPFAFGLPKVKNSICTIWLPCNLLDW
jgi:hypothetical protein